MNTSEDSNSHWSDEPYDPAAQDTLGRDPFVSTMVARINHAKANDPSTVFGLVGEWGSGKSSVISRVRRGLGDDWLTDEFTPWSSGDSASMSLEFVSTLAEILGKKSTDDVRAKLSRYAKFATPLLSAIPIFGGAAQEIADKTISAVDQRPPWHKQFEELSEIIESIGKKVLIIVDDVDRLGGQELLNLLRIVRLLGRFRGVHYLLAYDQDTVEDLLRSTGSVGRSTAFMEKIVQYPFETPPIPRAAVIRLLNDVLKELLKVTGVHLDEVGLLRSSELTDILSSQIRTPRTLGRFREHLLAFASHVESAELDLLDYVAVTWLRLNAHGVWAQLSHWHQELRTGSDSSSLTNSQKISGKQWEERISKVLPNCDPAKSLEVLSFLFSGVTFRGNSLFRDHPRKVEDARYLGRYLLLDIPEDDVSSTLVYSAIEALLSSSSNPQLIELARIIDGPDDSRSAFAIQTIAELRRGSKTTSIEILNFIMFRIENRNSETEQLNSPHRALGALLAREVACGVLSGLFSVEEIIAIVGEVESLPLVWGAARSLEFESRDKEILSTFANYWEGQLASRFAEFAGTPQLGLIADLLYQAFGQEKVQGYLDDKISNYDDYISQASSFVYFGVWVGTEVGYEMTFRSEAFFAMVSPYIHQKYDPQVSKDAGSVVYRKNDLPSTEVGADILRAFAIDSIAMLPHDF